ncbi:hypothetical protein [Nonomuraea fuscirosea]|uniref:hypothetical protein n=1 Tax=Nonomuraea fuscirosea TaxID=1291556 RepID=UPI0034445575
MIQIEMGTHHSPNRNPGFTLDGRRHRDWCRHFIGEFDGLWEAAMEVTDADWYPAQRG